MQGSRSWLFWERPNHAKQQALAAEIWPSTHPCHLTIRGPVHELIPENCCHPLDKKFLVPVNHGRPSESNVGDKSICSLASIVLGWITPEYGSHFNLFSFDFCVSPMVSNVEF